MKYFTSVSMLTGLGAREPGQPGSLEIAFEAGFIPTLSEDERRVGFVGSKVEDLNRSSLFGRVRATVGLPKRLTFTLGLTPPIEIDGVTPELVGFAIARPLVDNGSWLLNARLHGQLGKIKGDLTCPRSVAGLADPELNPDDCREPSRDEATQDYIGLELSASPTLSNKRWTPHVAVSVNYLDLEFAVDARYSVFLDTMVLETNGYTYSLTGGLSYRLSDTLAIGGEIFYSPLDVVRSARSGSTNDPLLNGRFALRARLR